ncbi:MAG: NAD(P)-dependent oxidoreductase [Chloroflexi bacterium]|nr:NAD(P)-dependent oxidoreductase [Chloroflexota bacterium]
MSFLVAGVGYIGSKLVEELLRRGERVVGIDNFFATDSAVLRRLRREPGFRLVRGSISNARTLHTAFSLAGDVEAIFALAAQASAHPDAATARYTESTNLLAPRLMLEAAREFRVPALVFASSFKVYGEELPAIVDESTPYGRFRDLSHLSKCYVEKLLEMYAGLGGMRCVAVRLGIVYGVAPVMKLDHRFMTAPNKFCLQVVRGEDLVVNPGAERPTGFIHVADAVSALLASLKFQEYVAVNAATEITSVAEVARLVARIASARGHVVNVRAPGPDTSGATPRVVSILDDAGFAPGHTLRAGLREVVDYFDRTQAARHVV